MGNCFLSCGMHLIIDSKKCTEGEAKCRWIKWMDERMKEIFLPFLVLCMVTFINVFENK